MGISLIDGAIIVLYFLGALLAGIFIARSQRTGKDYFLGGGHLAWWAVGFSIVASETSTLTFISVPGLAYGSNLQFLQVVFGYFVGRLIVAFVFLPAYFRGSLETAYEFLGKRFGAPLRRFASSVFLVTRVLASGVRLYATAIPVHLITGYDYTTSILIIGVVTLAYTYLGGLRAVVTMDVVQLVVYATGAIAAMAVILAQLPDGWNSIVAWSESGGADKFRFIDLAGGNSFDAFFANPYTLGGGLIGGAFLSMASHGTDQLLVQRLLGCGSVQASRRALLLDASAIVVQFAFFLVLGLGLFAFYHGATIAELGLRSTDEIFPKFILESLPVGARGLLIAGIFASAMGTLSSAISALSSSTYLDLFRESFKSKIREMHREVAWSRGISLVWGILLIGGAMLFIDTTKTVIEIGLQITSITYGGLLGVFFLGLLSPHTNQRDAALGFIAGLLIMVLVVRLTGIGFTWHTLIGCSTTLIVGTASRAMRGKAKWH